MKIYWDKVVVMVALLTAICVLVIFGAKTMPPALLATLVTLMSGVLGGLLPPQQKLPPPIEPPSPNVHQLPSTDTERTI